MAVEILKIVEIKYKDKGGIWIPESMAKKLIEQRNGVTLMNRVVSINDKFATEAQAFKKEVGIPKPSTKKPATPLLERLIVRLHSMFS